MWIEPSGLLRSVAYKKQDMYVGTQVIAPSLRMSFV